MSDKELFTLKTPHFTIEGRSRAGHETWFRIRDVGKADFESSIGKPLTVELSRARDHSLSGLIRTITMPNGRVVSACPQNC